jgi:hypothetical protein
MKYFIKSNATRPVVVEGDNYFFDIAEQSAGTSWGIYQTDDQNLIEAFLEAGVLEINQFEYDRLYEKKSSHHNYSVDVSSQINPPLMPKAPAPNPERQPLPPTKEAEKPSDPVAEDDLLADLTAVQPIDLETEVEAEAAPEYVSKMSDIAEMFDLEEHIVREYIKENSDLKRDYKKGYSVSAWKELLASEE